MSKLSTTIQAILLIFSLVFIIIFVYLFVTNIHLLLPLDKQAATKDRHRHDHNLDSPPSVSKSPKDDTVSSGATVSSSSKDVIVSTNDGQIRGFVQNVFGHNVSTFLGIPFAAPPVGGLRFKRTSPISKPWAGKILDTIKFKNKCSQIQLDTVTFTDVSSGMSEDCLYLNVWTPVDLRSRVTVSKKESISKLEESKRSDKLLPVMVWVYGGGFFMGSSNYDETDGRVLAALGNVIVVTFEYRVGPFGFLDLDTDSESGNQGMFDQVAVFKWVKNNIASFGGNPESMTLFGESSGAIAIGLHMISNESSDMFNRAIFQSGSLMMTNAFFERSQKSIPDFVISLHCLDDPDDETSYNVKCLRKRSVDEILTATKDMHSKYFFAFPPNVDELFLENLPTEIIKSNQKSKIFQNIQDVLIGNNQKPFSYMLWLANKSIFGQNSTNVTINSIDDVKKIMTKDIGHLLQMPSFQINFLTNKLFSNLSENDSTDKWLDRLIDILGDVSFVCPSKILADELSGLGKNVHLYQFTHQSSGSKWGKWFGPTLHDEIPLIFGHALRFPNRYSGSDIELSKRLIKTWSHFAATGQVLDQLGIPWPSYTSSDHSFMELNSNSAKIGQKLHEDTCDTFQLGFDLLN